MLRFSTSIFLVCKWLLSVPILFSRGSKLKKFKFLMTGKTSLKYSHRSDDAVTKLVKRLSAIFYPCNSSSRYNVYTWPYAHPNKLIYAYIWWIVYFGIDVRAFNKCSRTHSPDVNPNEPIGPTSPPMHPTL